MSYCLCHELVTWTFCFVHCASLADCLYWSLIPAVYNPYQVSKSFSEIWTQRCDKVQHACNDYPHAVHLLWLTPFFLVCVCVCVYRTLHATASGRWTRKTSTSSWSLLTLVRSSWGRLCRTCHQAKSSQWVIFRYHTHSRVIFPYGSTCPWTSLNGNLIRSSSSHHDFQIATVLFSVRLNQNHFVKDCLLGCFMKWKCWLGWSLHENIFHCDVDHFCEQRLMCGSACVCACSCMSDVC